MESAKVNSGYYSAAEQSNKTFYNYDVPKEGRENESLEVGSSPRVEGRLLANFRVKVVRKYGKQSGASELDIVLFAADN